MFESLDFFQLVSKGGYTIIILIICSVILIAVLIEKFISLSRIKNPTRKEIDEMKSVIESGDIKTVVEISQKSKMFLGDVLIEGLKNKNGIAIKEAVLRKISQKILLLEKHLFIIGTIGVISPFVGLLGTVLGIMRAFHDLGKYGTGNPSIVSAGVSEALITTAAGLLIAIPSVMFYNYFLKKINHISCDIENTAFEILHSLIHGEIVVQENYIREKPLPNLSDGRQTNKSGQACLPNGNQVKKSG
ncbi:MAG: MotA/TolQ/ExbB proton channel family protein [Elusimicrobiota bacterium]